VWFKNLAVYKFSQEMVLHPHSMNEALMKKPFTPCQTQEEFSFGWVPPVGEQSDVLVHGNFPYLVICGKKEEKILPGAAITEQLVKRVTDIEEREARKLPHKEKLRLRDEVIFELLPRALTQSAKTFAYIDPTNGYLIVDAASSKKAEDLLSQLRKCLGSLPVVPLQVIANPTATMTSWLHDHNLPDQFRIEDECELRSPEKEGGVIRCKHHDLALPEIKNHLDSGKSVHKLSLSWSDKISFTLDANLAIKRLKFLDLIQEAAANTEAVDQIEQFNNDFYIMAGEIASMLTSLIDAFGGQIDKAETS
jgi:recombination associated protein RdgC